MANAEDRYYYEKRLREEREREAQASNIDVARAHAELAARYERLLSDDEDLKRAVN